MSTYEKSALIKLKGEKMIIKLPKSLCNQIAAGEVVERPSSVVKELVENAIDAGAKNILLEFKNAGKEMISIKDDGDGIPDSDLPLVFERNATSKISKIEDLYELRSLGFRGEALASISSVSKVVLISRHKDSPLGNKLVYYNGEVKESQSLAASKGTTLIVSDLFYNTPARYKFLKSGASEKASIMAVMIAFALSHPEISFTVLSDGQEEFRSSGRGSLEETIRLLFEREFSKALLPVDKEKNGVRIKGFIAAPDYSRGNRSRQFLFVNGRMVSSKFLTKAIENSYDGMMMKRRYPAYVLMIEIEPGMIDVNIHPQKLELKFEREDLIETLVYNLIRNTLLDRRISRHLDISKVSSYEKDDIFIQNIAEEKTDLNHPEIVEESLENYTLGSLEVPSAPFSDAFAEETIFEEMLSDSDLSHTTQRQPTQTQPNFLTDAVDMNDSSTYSEGARRWETRGKIEENYLDSLRKEKSDSALRYQDFKVLAQVLETFIVCESEGSVFFIDQHAAHERVLFERFYKMFKERAVEHQLLLEPVEYRAEAFELDRIEEAFSFLKSLGLEVERASEKIWKIHSMPVFLEAIRAEEMIDIIDKYAKDGRESYHKYFMDQIIMQSCKAAIKSGDLLNIVQMEDLIRMLGLCDNPHSCPHGRPTTIEMKRSDFDKIFRRVL